MGNLVPFDIIILNTLKKPYQATPTELETDREHDLNAVEHTLRLQMRQADVLTLLFFFVSTRPSFQLMRLGSFRE